jgi:GntR family transcriptional regulator, transcriptional repressor for pyruvate dehydrogenase complex
MDFHGDPTVPVLQPMSRDSLAQRVANALKAFIVAQNLRPGSQLPSERQLSEAFAVSRNIVREGLSALVAEGIVIKKPGSGAYLREFDRELLGTDGGRVLDEQEARYNAVREARAAVEMGAIGLICNRITDEEIHQLERTVIALERKLERGEPYFKDDLRFHLILLRAARNELLLQWTPMVEEVMRTWSYHSDALAAALRSSAEEVEARRVASEHRAILGAVRRRDVEEARRLLREHLKLQEL